MKLASPHSDRECLLTDGLAQATAMDQKNGGRDVNTTRVIPMHLRAVDSDHSSREHWLQTLQRDGEWECAGGDDLPNLSFWTRTRLQLVRLLAGFRRR